MKFTIITASFNSDKTIQRTIESVLNQTITDFEYVLIDGKSNDDTIEIIESFEPIFSTKGINFKWVSEPDCGIYNAWNKGLKLARGNWISFLGSDDYYLPTALEMYNELIDKSGTSYDWLYSNVKYESVYSRVLDKVWRWKSFRRNITITPAHVGSFHNKKYFEKYGFFDESYKIAGDYEMLLRARDKLRTAKINKVTAVMQSGGVSNSMFKNVLQETFRAKLYTGGVPYLTCVFDYYVLSIKLKLKTLFNRN